MSGHDIIAIGASAGGVETLLKLVKTLPADLPASLFVVLHIPAQSPSLLPEILNRAGTLHAIHPKDNTKIEHGHIYIAPPDHHLLLAKDHIHIARGPKENRHRPAVDPLFRSAALTYGQRVVGVVLTGALDDGTAGLMAIKRRGGIAVVQDPQDALYPSMPRSALEHIQVDYCVPLSGMGAILTHLAYEATGNGNYPVPETLIDEVKIAGMESQPLNNQEQVGVSSVFSCPECGGVLWELQENTLLRFRCRTGHAYSAESVLAEQSDVLERSLWAALRVLEERVSLSQRMITQAQAQGRDWLVRNLTERLQEAEEHARQLRQILITSFPQNETASHQEPAQ